jgi:FAD/FMN-containing dehydrogenase
MARLTRRELLAAAGLTAAGLVVSCSAPPTEAPPLAQPEVNPNAWADLEKSLRGSVIRPDGAGYAELATPRNLRFAATMPEAVVQCAGTDDVAAAITWARKTKTPFAIRGGGHNYASASSSRGIVLSTRTMNAATITGTTLRAQAGVRNADLAKLLPQGGSGRLLLPGGNCPGVGVAGLTLGGGIGPNAPWAGLTADRLRKVTMVTADGAVVTASAAENPDLFWGLRGGAGGNFGVVTDLEYELVEVPVTRATTAEFTFAGRDAAQAGAVAFQKVRAAAERTATGNLYLGNAQGDIEGAVHAQALTGEAEARQLFGPLLAVPGVKAEIVERPWWDVYRWYVTEPSPAYSFWDRSLYADDYLADEVLAHALDVVGRFPANGDPERYGAMGIYGWVGGAVNDVAAEASAYLHRSAKILAEMSAGWATPTESTLPDNPIPPDIKEWEEELWQTLLPHTNGHSYQNFPDPGLTEWATAYYGDNLPRLEGLKATWDPGDVFAHEQGIPLPR